jgi:RNA polymerase subunit RPABC4/transcription elongation factor Spt4
MPATTIRIHIPFTPSISVCPSCGSKRLKDGLRCNDCGYHAGAQLSKQWRDFVQSLHPPVGEIRHSREAENENQYWIEVEVMDVSTLEQLTQFDAWLENIGGVIDEEHRSGALARIVSTDGPRWVRLYPDGPRSVPKSSNQWELRNNIELQSMLNGTIVIQEAQFWRWGLARTDNTFLVDGGNHLRPEATQAGLGRALEYITPDDILRLKGTANEWPCRWAIEQVAAGEAVYVGQDGSGYHFAVEVR